MTDKLQLAIDTATDVAGLALARQGEIVAEMTWRAGRNHTVQLLPNLEHLLTQVGATVADLDAVIVAKGPGSYNGLRVGVATAKGLAHTLGIPLVAVSTLEAEAFQHARTGRAVCAVLDARRGQLAAAIFQAPRGRWRQLHGEHLTDVDGLAAKIDCRTLFCGELSAATVAGLRKHLRHRAVIVRGAAGLRRAAFMAELGWRRIQHKQFDDPATLQPLYMRPAPGEGQHT